ncbi:siderophore-interacting protein [Chelatococcus reniformis]|uniref:SIP-like Rossmann fold domain-containing protein n=1 Tax=Chelatococcus reniformis TaxID=1494448 RepID=A0A916TXL1_9HYPH|nr:siderophore-interacting protein [Chelatococcus reniformis]GGC48703.1 hypothetical protein GCM10010994_04860 [Chelatococcus reniformis]
MPHGGRDGRPVPQADWYLLVGETALPAIARTLEALPAHASATALIEVADTGEEQALHSKAKVDLRWLHRNGASVGATSLLPDAVREVPMRPADTPIHAMAGVEFTAFQAIRRYWRDELRLDNKDTLAAAYWRRGRAEGNFNHSADD